MDLKESDARIRDLEHIVEEKEREIQMLRDSIHEFNNSNPVGEERVLRIERELKEIDGLVRGLTAEMLDLKACVQKLSKSLDEKPVARKSDEIKSKSYPVVESPKMVADRKSVEKARSASPEEPKEEQQEVLIIQPDGTMRREAKFGEDMIIADHRSGRISANGSRRPGERDPIDRKPLIYADDDDTVEIKRKRK
ncbi:MAG: hypothetical protein PHP13_07480 [Methanomicrobium sp.]|nr:hypothetical protein [Methanomicrobium sp.]MDD4127549.1 hypothetical protein [Methanomicrobium sp.]